MKRKKSLSVPAKRTNNEHGGIRTPDPQNRNLMLYPAELHAQNRPGWDQNTPEGGLRPPVRPLDRCRLPVKVA